MTNTQPRPVPTHPGYSAFPDGRIINSVTGRTLKPRRHKRSGYFDVQPLVKGKQRRVRVHAMVLAAFAGPRPDGLQCRHLDGNKANNAISNLRWGSPRQNYEDSIRHGTAVGPKMVGCVGEAHPAHRLSEQDAEDVKFLAGIGESYSNIAEQYGISRSLVGMIARGIVWKHLPPSPGLRLLVEQRQRKIAA